MFAGLDEAPQTPVGSYNLNMALLGVDKEKEKEEWKLRESALICSLTWEEIKTLSDDPLCTIGAHTVNHFPLSRLSEEQLKFEIQYSKERIESFINKTVNHFAYPFGKQREASIREFEMVKELGFKTGTTTRIGNIFQEHRMDNAVKKERTT